jgi:CO dehydrogenase/acetyl-CoA synthase gamma subunit (corrinoid Fe-S protein)
MMEARASSSTLCSLKLAADTPQGITRKASLSAVANKLMLGRNTLRNLSGLAERYASAVARIAASFGSLPVAVLLLTAAVLTARVTMMFAEQ